MWLRWKRRDENKGRGVEDEDEDEDLEAQWVTAGVNNGRVVSSTG